MNEIPASTTLATARIYTVVRQVGEYRLINKETGMSTTRSSPTRGMSPVHYQDQGNSYLKPEYFLSPLGRSDTRKTFVFFVSRVIGKLPPCL
jgi:hypothetical protein